MKTIFALLATSLLLSCGKSHPKVTTPMTETKYKVGQVWNYQTREAEAGSHLFIVRADPDEKLGVIYHIYVDGIRIKNPHSPSGSQDHLPHSPVSEKTLDDSVTSLATNQASELPDISEGYAAWRKAYDNNQGGVFTIPVKQIIQYIEDIVNGKSDRG